MSSGDPWSLPIKQGLYDPTLEKDACGVGFIVAIDGKRSHKAWKKKININYQLIKFRIINIKSKINGPKHF